MMNLNWDDPLAVTTKPEPVIESPAAETVQSEQMMQSEPQLQTVQFDAPTPTSIINDTLARSPQPAQKPTLEPPVKAKKPTPELPEFNPSAAEPVNAEDKRVVNGMADINHLGVELLSECQQESLDASGR